MQRFLLPFHSQGFRSEKHLHKIKTNKIYFAREVDISFRHESLQSLSHTQERNTRAVCTTTRKFLAPGDMDRPTRSSTWTLAVAELIRQVVRVLS